MSHRCPDCGHGCQTFAEQRAHDCMSSLKKRLDYSTRLVDSLETRVRELEAALEKHIELYCPKYYDEISHTWIHYYDELKAVLKKSA